MKKIEELKGLLAEGLYENIEQLFDTVVYFDYDYLCISRASWEDLFYNIVNKLCQKSIEECTFIGEVSKHINKAVGVFIRKKLMNNDIIVCDNLLVKLKNKGYKRDHLLAMFVFELKMLNIDFTKGIYNLLKDKSDRFLNVLKYSSFANLTYEEIVAILNKKYKLNISLNKEDIDYAGLSVKYSDKTWEEIKELYGEEFYKLSSKSVSLLERYYGVSDFENFDVNKALREINIMLFGYKRKNTTLDLGLLKNVYLIHKQEFNEEQQLYLESYVFNMTSKSEFLNKYSNSTIYRKYKQLIDKLERLYFGIDDLFSYTLTKEQYLSLKDKKQLSDKNRELLDLYYGINGEALSIIKLSELYMVDFDAMRKMVFEARKCVIHLLCNFGDKISIDENIYSPYIVQKKYELNDEVRDILKLFVIEGISYEDIAKKYNKATTDIAIIISKGIQRIDAYRFGIDKPIKFTKQSLDGYFAFKKSDILIEKVIRLKYLEFLTNEEIAKIVGLEKSKVNRIVSDFNNNYIIYEIKNVEIDNSEIEEEINRHIVDSVITELEKSIISYYYGIKSKYNPKGEKLTSKKINEKLDITGDIARKSKDIINKIKRRKIGDLVPELIYMDRNDLASIITDPHLPISNEDKKIICYLLELNGYPLKTCRELAEIFKVNEKGIKRKYQMAIINISKYLLGEKEGVISYKDDIVPNLKYFTANERLLITDYYHLNLSYQEIANKYNISLDKIKKVMYRIKIQLNNIISGDVSRMFDFDYYFEVIDKEDLPFYGNKNLAKKIFELYVGIHSLDKMPIKEIKDKLGLDLNENTILNVIRSLILSVFKYKDGIKKNKTFTFDDAKTYYCENKDNLSFEELKMFASFFNKNIGVDMKMSEDLTFVLLKGKYPNCFDFSDLTKKEAIDFLRKYSKEISKNARYSVMFYAGITERELMTGQEKNHVFRILADLDKKLTNEEVEKLSR